MLRHFHRKDSSVRPIIRKNKMAYALSLAPLLARNFGFMCPSPSLFKKPRMVDCLVELNRTFGLILSRHFDVGTNILSKRTTEG
jgi:hypothetical protein